MLTSVAPVFTRLPLVLAFAELGELTKGIAQGEEALRIAEMVGQPFSLVIALVGLGHVNLVKGDLDKAIPMLERSLDICRNAPVRPFLPFTLAELGYAYLHSGSVPKSVTLLEEAVNQPTLGLGGLLHHSWLGEAYLLANQRERAVEVAQRALELARDRNERGHEAWALRSLGQIASHGDRLNVEKAEDYYRQAIALAEELGMRPFQTHCHLGLGRLYRRIDDLQQAKKNLTTATTMMRDMQMRLWLEKADAELKELS